MIARAGGSARSSPSGDTVRMTSATAMGHSPHPATFGPPFDPIGQPVLGTLDRERQEEGQHGPIQREQTPTTSTAVSPSSAWPDASPARADLDTFWANLRDGVESIRTLDEAELLAAGESREVLHDPSYVPAGAPLEGIDQFDAAFFGMSPRDAAVFDPQHRLFLECAWEAFEHAGYVGSRHRRCRRRVRHLRAQRVHVQERAGQRRGRVVSVGRVARTAHRQRHELPWPPGCPTS